MLLSFRAFGGIAPKVDPRRLPDTGAQTALNTKLWRGNLQPFRAKKNVYSLPAADTTGVKTIYRWGQTLDGDDEKWMTWTVDADVCKGFIASDTTERTYWTGDGVPKKGDSTKSFTGTKGTTHWPSASWPLAVPRPSNAPTVTQVAINRNLTLADTISVASATVSQGGTSPSLTTTIKDNLVVSGSGTPQLDGSTYAGVTTEEWVYVYTYVTAWGEESAPSDASAVITVDPAVAHTITTDTGPSPNDYNITLKRIYRSATGTSGNGAYQLVGVKWGAATTRATDVPVAQAAVTDDSSQDELNEMLPSLNWDTPPDDLAGLCTMANGIMVGFSGNNLCFSEAYRPHAWPTAYRQALDYNIVGVKAFTTYVVVGTEGFPYVFQGSDPASMLGQKLEAKQACVSKRSMVSMGDGVIYASPDGLIFVGPSGIKNLTEDIFTRDDWQALTPKNIAGYAHEGRYYAFNSTNSLAFVLDPSVPAVYTLGEYPQAAFQDLKRDALYVVPPSGSAIYKWEGDTALLNYTWRSKKYVLPRAINMAVAQVEAQAYPVTFRLFVDGVQRGSDFTVANESPFRLPSGYMGKEVEIEVSGSATVNAVYVATSMQELAEA